MDTLTDPQTWLVLVALIHAVVGVILPTDWSKDSNKMMGGFVLLTSVTMLYAAFCMDGERTRIGDFQSGLVCRLMGLTI